jgi:hypothetical protein
MMGIWLLIAEKGSEGGVVMWLMVPYIYWINFFVLVLQMIGWLPAPAVAFLWLIEQCEILLFGGTQRASDLRILVSFLVNTVFVIIFTHSDVKSDANLTIVYALVAYLTSKNYMHTFGLKKPFKIENEEMVKQRTHSDIVFSGLEGGKEKEELEKERNSCTTITMIFNGVEFVLILIAAVLGQVLFIEEDDPT